MIKIGETVKVQIVRINRETQRICLGMKQLESDPWEGAAAKYPVDGVFKGRVTNITEYGAFVELEPGIEGLVHVSEMSWTKKNVHPGKIVSTSQEVDVAVLEVDEEKRRISLGLKQAQANPWAAFAEKHPVGTEVEGEVKNATEFGLFIGLDGKVATITLNRPQRKNPLTFESYAELRDTFRDLTYAGRSKVVVITGAGDNFCSGGDVHEIIGPLVAMQRNDDMRVCSSSRA